MAVLNNLESLPSEATKGAVSIGNFDGVHAGHRHLVEHLRDAASKVSGPSVVFTFWPSPISILAPEKAPALLTTISRRAELLTDLGVDYVVACPTNQALLDLTAEEFFQEIILNRFDCRAIVEGPNFYFGKNRGGDIRFLDRMCQYHNVDLSVVSPQSRDGELVSSSRIRTALESGDIEQANRMLVEPYRLSGKVIHGEHRGRKLGFPTANLTEIAVQIPQHGVYAGRVRMGGCQFAAAIHIGPNPTFEESMSKVEVHLIDFQDDLYDAIIDVEFLRRIRGVKKFESRDLLLQQVASDVAVARRHAGQ